MSSILTSKPKRGRGTIKVDQDHAKRQGAVQSLKNLYQKPISAMVKAPAWGMAAAIATPTFINSALNKDSYVQDYTRKRLLNLNDGYSKSREMKRVASIPTIALSVWANEYNGSNNWFGLPKEIQKKY